MRDWPNTLLPASFSGFPFYIEKSGETAGHRVNTTEIPNGAHVNERFGPSARTYELTGYFVGDAVDFAATAFLALCEGSPLGMLTLPDSLPAMVNIKKCARAFEKDKLGYVALEIEAVAEPAFAPGGDSADLLERQVYQATAAAVTSAGRFLAAAIRT